ncbi:hypothetical protein P280DRAFT_498897 [Massarina eburnea CBS 473.64]|uniref:DUF6594 domain-containing protein n=1 Tax=Massarina eburnea CBS 473.64 TaxID=1395130 RepID=A0A6A6RX15_9PLEO|nr:hypothetical protein P280DRAFT_498897 [Massarina eburnea CBS 473.64]
MKQCINCLFLLEFRKQYYRIVFYHFLFSYISSTMDSSAINVCHEKADDMEAGKAGMSFDTEGDSSTACEQSISEVTIPLSEEPRGPWWKAQLTNLQSTVMRQWMTCPHGKRECSVRTLESCPRGYPNLAAFLDSDESFMVYRRFGFIQARLLLEKQDELRELEEALDRLDKKEEKADFRRPMTRDMKKEHLKPRTQLLEILETKFTAYANLVCAAQKMASLNRPSKEDLVSVQNYMANNKPLITKAEAAWKDLEEDVITLRGGREHAWLDSTIERLLKFFHCRLLERLFGDERTQQKSCGNAVYYSHTQIARLANCIITCMVLILLVVPIYVLYHLINDIHTERAYAVCIGVLCVSTLAFSAVLSLFTRAKRHEILAAAAAYCAVLVVFLGNVGVGNQNANISH